MTDRYRWAGIRPHDRGGESDPIEPGDVFEPTDAELAAFDDLLEPVDEDDVVRPADEPPFDPSEYTVSEIEERLEEGDFDEPELLALDSAEAEDKDRETALDAIVQAEEELEV